MRPNTALLYIYRVEGRVYWMVMRSIPYYLSSQTHVAFSVPSETKKETKKKSNCDEMRSII